jgi:hypothetical protein
MSRLAGCQVVPVYIIFVLNEDKSGLNSIIIIIIGGEILLPWHNDFTTSNTKVFYLVT